MAKAICTCAAEGCDRRLYGKGYCKTHYHQFMKTGQTRPIGPYKLAPGASARLRTATRSTGHRAIAGRTTTG